MKLSERKRQFVEELAGLQAKVSVERLIGYPRQNDTQEWLAEVASIFKNLDEGDYQEIVRLSKTITPTENRVNRTRAAHEIYNFVRRKVAEWRRYDFSSLDNNGEVNNGGPIGVLNKGKGNIFASNKFAGFDIGIVDEGEGTKAIDNDFQGTSAQKHKSSFGNFNILGGTVTNVFGDGNKITQVTARELVEALSEEIQEKVSEGEAKKNVLHTLKEITTNETFASVAGTVIGEILRRVTRP